MKRTPLEGKKYGLLYVLEYVGSGKYKCQCDCGKECVVNGANLKKNHTTSCGCKKTLDLSGKIFGFLKVLGKIESKKRGDIKRTRWKCECLKCGKITEVYTDSLTYGFTNSCGCLQNDKQMCDKIKDDYIDGTQISKILCNPTKANKSGFVGVNWARSKSKWQASIRFKGHKYNLGYFEDFDLACKARKEAEELLFKSFLEDNNIKEESL